MNRVSIVGNSGSGKSTLARALGTRLGVPVLELDSLFHQANWTPLPTIDFQRRLGEFMSTHPRWVVDGNYPAVLPDVWAAADTVIWLSPSRAENMRAILGRTLCQRFGAAMHDSANAHLRFVRLDSRRAATDWLAEI